MAIDRSKGATPATMLLQQSGVAFTVHQFDHHLAKGNYGDAAAEALGVDPEQVFKTLLVAVESLAAPSIAVGIVPVSGQLSLKEMAAAVGAKRAEMCDPTVAERVTGYVVGGISPFGQKKKLPTAIDDSCLIYETIFVSGGKHLVSRRLATGPEVVSWRAVGGLPHDARAPRSERPGSAPTDG